MMKKMKKLVVMLLVLSFLCAPVGMVPVDATQTTDSKYEDLGAVDSGNLKNENTYYNYLQKHADAKSPNHEIPVDIDTMTVEDAVLKTEQADGTIQEDVIASGTTLYENRDGSNKGVDIRAKGEKVIFTITVPETGMYSAELKYLPSTEKASQYLFGFYIDNELPFTEANSCKLSRVYKNAEIVEDPETGDDRRPSATETPEWRTQFLFDQTGVYGTLKFYLTEGEHTIALCFDGTPLLLESITLKQEPELKSYKEYIAENEKKGYKQTQGYLELIQAENYYQQSSAALWPSADKTSPLTMPFSYDSVKINYGGGSQWKTPGDWITWEVEAPEDGFYQLGFRYKQGYLDGMFSSRKIYIDGVVPFQEMNAVRFNYTATWQNMVLGGEDPYSIYLTKGKHTITFA